jgi:GcvH upstream region-like protein
MLSFFRKHQRIFFIIVTVVVVISFSFFGTFSSFAPSAQEGPDKALVKGIDGSEIMQREVSALCKLIGTSPLDKASRQRGNIPNLMNDSVIEKDLIASGMALMIARRYFDEIKPDIEACLTRIKSHRFYVHPQSPAVGAESIWNRFIPHLNQHLTLLKVHSDQATLETLSILLQLYLDQTALPSEFVRQLLMRQVEQLGLTPDPQLAYADLSLFGFHTLEDWVGPKFIELAGQFMINAARYAEEKGYQVSPEAVRSELYQNIVHNYREMFRTDKVKTQDIDAYYQAQLQHLGLDESALVRSWRNVALFRRLFRDVGNSVFLDPLPFQQFHHYTKGACQIELYELPDYLQFTDLSDVCKFQVYLDAVAANQVQRKNPLSLPQECAAIDQIEKRAPELVEQKVKVEYAEVCKEDLLREISLKETWDWEVEESSWTTLKQHFPHLASLASTTKGERIQALDRLDAPVRLKVDAYAQECILALHPERITAALDRALMHEAEFGLRGAGNCGPFNKIKDSRRLSDLLRKATIQGVEISQEALSIQKTLDAYSEDQQTYYRIHLLGREEERNVLTFYQARKDGTLDKMLDKRLEEAYPEARRKQAAAFQRSDGTWKPLKEVREKVCRIAFSDLLKAIEDSQKKLAEPMLAKGGELPSSFYTQYRFFTFLSDVKKQIEANPDDPQWVRTDRDDHALVGQWKLIKSSRTVERSSDYGFAKEQMFHVPVMGWSSVDIGRLGSLAFYRVVGREEVASAALDEIKEGHHLISMEAQRAFLSDLLDTIQEKRSIALSEAL